MQAPQRTRRAPYLASASVAAAARCLGRPRARAWGLRLRFWSLAACSACWPWPPHGVFDFHEGRLELGIAELGGVVTSVGLALAGLHGLRGEASWTQAAKELYAPVRTPDLCLPRGGAST